MRRVRQLAEQLIRGMETSVGSRGAQPLGAAAMTPAEVTKHGLRLQAQVRERLQWCMQHPVDAANRYGVKRIEQVQAARTRLPMFLGPQLRGWCEAIARDMCGPFGEPWEWNIHDGADGVPLFTITAHTGSKP